MSSTNIDPTMVLNTGHSDSVYAVVFHPDGTHLLSGHSDGIQRWRLADGQEVGKQTGMVIRAICVSRDDKWIACGTDKGANVWDGELREKVFDVEGTSTVWAVDVSPDSTRFATGTDDHKTSVWSITSGKRLVGPLKHADLVMGVKFSPDGRRIATACKGRSVRVFDSHNGDEIINIKTIPSPYTPITPLAWSNNGQHIFVAAADSRVQCFQISTGSQLAESHILHDSGLDIESIALATSGKFIATYAGYTVFFLDSSTLARIDPVIKDSSMSYSIALSPDCNYLVTGLYDGKISVHALGHIFPDSYGPFHPSAHEERPQGEQPSTSGSHDNKRTDSTVERPGKSSLIESIAHNEDGGDDLLEAKGPSGSAAPEFDYVESLSTTSTNSQEEEALHAGTSNAAPQLLDALPTASPRDAPAEEDPNMAKSSQGIRILKRLLPTRIRKGNKDPGLHESDRVPVESPLPAQHQSRSQSPTRVQATNKGPSWMAATKRVPRTVAKPVVNQKRKSPAKPTHSNKGASRSEQGAAGAAEAGPAQHVNDESQPSAGMIRVTDQRESGYSVVSIKLPSWMLCRGSAAEDGTHG